MREHQVARPRGSRKLPRRLGRGTSQGQGKTAGRGTKGPRGRELSCVTRGRLRLIASIWRDEGWPEAALWPEPWPEQFPRARKQSAAKQHKQQKARERQRVKRRKRKAARRMGQGKGKKAA